MYNRIIVEEALKRSWTLDNIPGLDPCMPAEDQSSVISQLIFDIFGGEILKTPKKKGWHFYNRIDGERIDFTRSDVGTHHLDFHSEDLPSTPDETSDYFEQEDYSSFFMRFVWALEEAAGVGKFKPEYSA